MLIFLIAGLLILGANTIPPETTFSSDLFTKSILPVADFWYGYFLRIQI